MSTATLYRRTQVKEATIASGASLSGEIDLEGYVLLGIIMPSAWTTADLSFQVSDESGGTFVDLYDDNETEVVVEAAASRGIGVDTFATTIGAFRYLKVRSGDTGTPVTQGAERTIKLVLKA